MTGHFNLSSPLELRTTAAARKRITEKDLGNPEVCIPDLTEQRLMRNVQITSG